MRLFTAVELSDEVRSAVVVIQQELRRRVEPSNDVRWVRPDHLHLTLTFMPQVDPDRAEAIVQALAAPIVEDPFELAFGGIGVFPERGAPRVVWLGIRQGIDALRRVRDDIAARLAHHVVANDPKPFNPHLTLGRWREGKGRASRRLVDGGGGDISHRRHLADKKGRSRRALSPVMRVESVTLFESRLSSSGPSYTALCRTPLTCR